MNAELSEASLLGELELWKRNSADQSERAARSTIEESALGGEVSETTRDFVRRGKRRVDLEPTPVDMAD